MRRRARRSLAPQVVDQPVDGEDLPGVEREIGEEHPGLQAAEAQQLTVPPGLERAEQQNLDFGHHASDPRTAWHALTPLPRRTLERILSGRRHVPSG